MNRLPLGSVWMSVTMPKFLPKSRLSLSVMSWKVRLSATLSRSRGSRSCARPWADECVDVIYLDPTVLDPALEELADGEPGRRQGPAGLDFGDELRQLGFGLLAAPLRVRRRDRPVDGLALACHRIVGVDDELPLVAAAVPSMTAHEPRSRPPRGP